MHDISEDTSRFLHWARGWLTPVILATQEAEGRRISVWSQPIKWAGGVAQGISPKFKPKYGKEKKKKGFLHWMDNLWYQEPNNLM
jgi:hypothetical protein